jgi:hypothetical protein
MAKRKNTGLYAALAVAALALVAALVGIRFFSPPPPPVTPPPGAPAVPPTERQVTATLRYTDGYYRAVLDEDAKRFNVAAVSPDALAAPLVHSVELKAPRTLRPGESIETAHLKIALAVVKEWATGGSGQGFRYEHLVLSVANRTDKPLAYRVDTAMDHPDRCRTKGAISHDAIALGAGERIERTECLWHSGETLRVERVEVIELPPLSYYYVSRLDPTQIGLDRRVSAGHTPRKAKLCGFVPWREIESSGATWADVIDFYARHNCDEYTFFAGYRMSEGPVTLPARPPQGEAADGGAHD